MLRTSFPALQLLTVEGTQFNAIIWCCFVFFCGLKWGIIVQPAEFTLQLLLLSKAQLSLCCINGIRGSSSPKTSPKNPINNPKSQTIPQPFWWGILSSEPKWAPLGGECFLCCVLEYLAKLWSDFGVSRCLGKSSCPFPAFCLPFPLPGFIPFLSHFRVSAVREGGCFRQLEKGAGVEHPGERTWGL